MIIIVRASKGDRDRMTVLPDAVKDRLAEHLEATKNIHEKDLTNGFGEVYLPEAIDRKYPNAARD